MKKVTLIIIASLLCAMTQFESLTVVKNPKELLNSYNMAVTAYHLHAKHHQMEIKSNWSFDLLTSVLNALHKNSHSVHLSSDKLDSTVEQLYEACQKAQTQDILGPVIINQDNCILSGHEHVAAALLYNKKVECTVQTDHVALTPTYKHLQAGEMDSDEIDALAFEHIKLNPNCYIAIIWPKGIHKLDWIVDYIAQHLGPIVHVRPFNLKNYGQYILLHHIDHKGAIANQIVHDYFKKKFDVVQLCAIIFETPKHFKEIKRVKGQIRAEIGGGWTSIHTEDSNRQSINTACMVLLENSVHHMNHMPIAELPKFSRLFKLYQQSVVHGEQCCVDNGAVLGAYAIREPGDWDFIQYKSAVKPKTNEVGGHNWFYNGRYTNLTADDIIFNPRYHFYYKGLKFASLDLVKNIKGKKRVAKDIRDLDLIKKHLSAY